METDELVNVLVPRRFLAQVYGLVAKLASENEWGVSSAESSRDSGKELGIETSSTAIAEGWSPALLRRMVNESSPALLRILEVLADQPESWLSTGDLAVAMGKSKDDSKAVGGTVSALGRRIKGRYRLNTFPFERRPDHLKRIDCRMSTGTASLLKQFIDERNG